MRNSQQHRKFCLGSFTLKKRMLLVRGYAPFPQDAERLSERTKFWNALMPMGVFAQLASNIKGFARKLAQTSAFRVLCELDLVGCLFFT